MKILRLVRLLLAFMLLPLLAKAQIKIELFANAATCQAAYKNGKITSKVSGGLQPYTYLWNNGATTPDTDSTLTAGFYTLTVTDATGLTAVKSAEVKSSQGFNLTGAIKQTDCNEQNGSITAIFVNKFAPISFKWNDTNQSNAQTISSLAAGNYSVTVTDKIGCSEAATFTIKKELSFTVFTNNHPCDIFQNLTVDNLKGTPPYLYAWSNGVSAPQIIVTNQNPGNYIVTVTDSNGCSGTQSSHVIISTSIIGSQNIIPTACDKSEGAVRPIFLDSPTKYQWSTGATTKDITGLPSGIYTLTVTSALGCTSVFPFAVQGKMNLKISNTIACNATNGTIKVESLSGGVAPFSYRWSNGSSTQVINTTTNFSHYVTVSDANGCFSSAFAQLIGYSTLNGRIEYDYKNCPKLTVELNNGIAPFSYTWSNTSTLPNIDLYSLQTNNYMVTLTDNNGCKGTFSKQLTKNDFDPNYYFEKKTCGNTAVLSPKCSNLDYNFKWDNGSTQNTASGLSKGRHWVTITDNQHIGAIAIDTFYITSDSTCYFLRGTIKHDTNNNCQVDAAEMSLEDEIVEILPGPIYINTDKNGKYATPIAAGNYTVSAKGKTLLEKPCQLAIPVTVIDTTTLDIPMKVALCPFMEVKVATPFLRRCFDNNYYVSYFNKGTLTAKNATITLILDKDLMYKSSSIPLASQNANSLIFKIGDVAAGEYKNFQVVLNLNCNGTILGQTHCVEARITPDSLCLPQPPLWSGAKVQANANCNGQQVSLTLKNTGDAPMIAAKNYIIIEDQVIYKQGTFKLNTNEILEEKFPANGKTYRIEAEQEIGFPLMPSKPSAWAEACGTNPQGGISMGFVPMFGNNGAQPFQAIDCHQSIGSYDPNEKTVYPIGYGNSHLLPQNESLEYTLHFQNEGTDTAFTVVLRDTLSNLLNISTLQMGASSHPYTWKVDGRGILSVTFDKINLTTKKQNEAKSQGFVQFRIAQNSDLPLGSLITNRAGIYFDFNSVIMTNEVFHKIGRDFVPMKIIKTNELPGINVSFYPNPIEDEAIFEIQGFDNQLVELSVFDLTGHLLRREQHDGKQFQFQKRELPSGLYLYQIKSNHLILSQGKLVINGR